MDRADWVSRSWAWASPCSSPPESILPTSRIIFVAVLLVGLGAATAFTPLLTMAVANVPAKDAGIGSGIVNVSQQVAAALSVAVLGAVSSSRTATLLAQGSSALDALDGGYRLAFTIALASVVIGIVVGVDHSQEDRSPARGSSVGR